MATNGGPYNADGSSIGTLIVNGGKVLQNETTSNEFVGFGKTETQYVMGKYQDLVSNNPHVAETIESFVTGFGWLVYKGETVETYSSRNRRRAPRTAVGVDDRGRLLVLVADGCEHW